MKDKEQRRSTVIHAVRNLKYRRAFTILVVDPDQFHIGDKVLKGTVIAIEKTERWICIGYK